MWTVVHHQEGQAVVSNVEVQHAHNVGMDQAGNDLSLLQEAQHLLLGHACMQDFDSGLALQIDVLAQVDLGKAALAQQADQAIFA